MTALSFFGLFGLVVLVAACDRSPAPPSPNASAPSDASSKACASNEGLVYEPGCDAPKRHCDPLAFASCAVANPYCGCDGKTFHACLPTTPFKAAGACANERSGGASR